MIRSDRGGPIRKGYRIGTHRQVPPAQTLARLRPLLLRMGITRLANVTGLDTIGIPVVMACRPNSCTIAVSQGKGLDLDSAKVSAAMESIESFHAERINHPLRLASYEDLRATHRVIDVDLLARQAGSRFHPGVPMLWIEGTDQVKDESLWIPYQIVHNDYTNRMSFDLGSFVATSNGLASGNHLFEAFCHGLCEVIECDAYLLWQLRRTGEQESTRVDLASIDDPSCVSLLASYERAGIAVAVWDITSDVGVAAFRCLISERGDSANPARCTAEGLGCHPVRAIALARALTEAAQSRLTVIAGSRDDMTRQHYAQWLDPKNLQERRHYAALPGHRPYRTTPSFESETFDADIVWLMERLRHVGIERVVVVDLTRPEFDLAVVRVVVPGMEQGDASEPTVPGPRARRLAETVP